MSEGLLLVAEMIAAIGKAAQGAALSLKEATVEAQNYQSTVSGMSGGTPSTGGMGASSGPAGPGGGITATGLTQAIQSLQGRS